MKIDVKRIWPCQDSVRERWSCESRYHSCDKRGWSGVYKILRNHEDWGHQEKELQAFSLKTRTVPLPSRGTCKSVSIADFFPWVSSCRIPFGFFSAMTSALPFAIWAAMTLSMLMSCTEGATDENGVAKVLKEKNDNSKSGNSDQELPSREHERERDREREREREMGGVKKKKKKKKKKEKKMRAWKKRQERNSNSNS